MPAQAWVSSGLGVHLLGLRGLLKRRVVLALQMFVPTFAIDFLECTLAWRSRAFMLVLRNISLRQREQAGVTLQVRILGFVSSALSSALLNLSSV